MPIESPDLKIVTILTIGFVFAGILGYLAYRIKLSPIVGYLLAGYLIGPYSPGFVADLSVAEQLAEIGVILMMFGVGLHIKWQDLLHVKNIAIPGAIGQTFFATLLSSLLIVNMGWPFEVGLILGLAIGVASTVVLVKVLHEKNLLHTPEGHVAVGWLIVEDLITVMALIMIEPLSGIMKDGEGSIYALLMPFALVFVKFAILAVLIFTLGRKLVVYCLSKIVHTHSSELFTLAILALTFLIATGSAALFGTSIALGAFLAGMVIGETSVRKRATKSSLPIKDAFVVIFFLSVGMLFNPAALFDRVLLFLAILTIILIVKPLIAFLLTIALKYPAKTAFTIAIALAQIGEFSFILTEEAMRYEIFPDELYDIIVACAFVSISINPLLFNLIPGSRILKE